MFDKTTGRLIDYDPAVLRGHVDKHDHEIYRYAKLSMKFPLLESKASSSISATTCAGLRRLAEKIFESNWEKYTSSIPKHPICQALLHGGSTVVSQAAVRNEKALRDHQAVLDSVFEDSDHGSKSDRVGGWF